MTDAGRLLPPRIAQWWPYMRHAAAAYGLDPLWLAAICEQETKGGQAPGYAPKGAAGLGDFGHGHGLFQIDDRSHADFLAKKLEDGTPAWQDPLENAIEAARILKAGIVAFHGDFFLAACSYNAGVHAVMKAVLKLGPAPTEEAEHAAADWVTTHTPAGAGYGTCVMEHLRAFRGGV